MSETLSGILEIEPRGFGFLRAVSTTLKPTPHDPHVPQTLVRSLGLKPGLWIEATGKNSAKGGKQVDAVLTINGMSLPDWNQLPDFSEHTVIQPQEPITLAGAKPKPAMRIMELFCPIGKGQRGLIVAPPKAGKTRLMQEIAHAVSESHPEMDLMVLLIDERPEEVTDMRRGIRGEVFASSSDAEGQSHLRLSQLVLEYAKRKVETHRDVILLIDSLTRMGRAFNVHQKGSGRTLSGGVDSRALQIPKRIFGAARNLEGGGSLTIMATILIETNSRMDELIFQEFKGTGNMELVLSRELADERIFPAIDLAASGTRNEELLFREEASRHHALRRSLQRLRARDAMLTVKGLLQKFPTNRNLLAAFAD